MESILSFLSNTWHLTLLVAVISYLLGSISFAILVTRWFSGTDIRNYGSGNAGATNVLRAQGVWPAAITAIGDLGKSVLSVLIGRQLFVYMINPDYTQAEYVGIIGSYVAGVFCVLGHLYPLFFKFRGGKGVITAFGLFLILDYRVALIGLAVFAVVVAISKMVSLGSMIASCAVVTLTFVFRTYVYQQPPIVAWFCTGVGIIVLAVLIIKHASNIKRIVQGTESKISIGKSKKQG